MKLIEQLAEPEVWREFTEYKVNAGHLSGRELAKLQAYTEEKRYLPAVEKVRRAEAFQPPKKKRINKIQKSQKRVVYVFAEEENYVLKLMTYLLLRKYDPVFAPNLYSFREKVGVKTAFSFFAAGHRTDGMYVYKADISNYFNTVDVGILLGQLEEILSEDREIYEFLKALLENPYVEEDGVLIREEKGIMAGCPIAAFLANVYLREMDRYFYESGVLYGRYSDDVILFTDTGKEREECAAKIRSMLGEKKLTLNARKEVRSEPHEPWTFLGISYCDGKIDVAAVSAEKLKQKMRRKARALLRWKNRRGADPERAVKAFINAFNRKIFDNPSETELTWGRWYFPIINTTETLEKIDHYMQDCIRYLATEKRNKGRFRFRYGDLKRLGYRSMVHEYYKGRKEKET